MQSNIQQYYPRFDTFYESHFSPGQTPVPPRSGTCIPDLSHDPIWAIWLAEVRKFHQHHDRIRCNLKLKLREHHTIPQLLPKIQNAFEILHHTFGNVTQWSENRKLVVHRRETFLLRYRMRNKSNLQPNLFLLQWWPDIILSHHQISSGDLKHRQASSNDLKH